MYGNHFPDRPVEFKQLTQNRQIQKFNLINDRRVLETSGLQGELVKRLVTYLFP